jgi:hypothetical protein
MTSCQRLIRWLEKSMKKLTVAFLFLSLLSGCSSGTPPAVKADIGSSSKINLDVATIDVIDRSGSFGADSPYAANNFKPTIAEAIRQWASQHFAAVGTSGAADIVVKDASLKTQALPHASDMFTREQASKYIAHAEVEIDINGHEGQGMVTAEASRFETLPEKPTAIERQNAYTTVLNGLVHDLGGNLDTGVREHIGNFVVTAPVLDVQPIK